MSELELLYELKKNRSVSELFEQIVQEYPKNIAIVFGDILFTYEEINTKANQLAFFLSHIKGIEQGSVVGFYADSSEVTIIAMIAILKIGCTYLPIDSKYPEDRIQYIINDSDIKYLLIESLFSDSLHAFNCPFSIIEDLEKDTCNYPTENLALSSYNKVAYIMYTSGTTGRPNGVLVPQSGIIRLVYSSYLPFSSNLVFLQLAPIGFDASTFEIWGALLHGARLVIYGNHIPEFNKIHFYLHKYKISCLWLTAALFNAIIDESPEILRGINYLLTGGEALSVQHIRKAQRILPETTFINGYGPTECTTFTCCYTIPIIENTGLKSIPIGKPITGTDILILDREMQLVKKGEEGELYVFGDGVALGYLNNSELTDERFIMLKDKKGDLYKAYKTGDLCRELDDGNIDFVGRLDSQVKINGFRIEVEEIEVCLKNYIFIKDVVVIVKQVAGVKKIIAYVIPKLSTQTNSQKPLKIVNLLDHNALKKYILSWLPSYMIPNQIIEVSTFPININGKIDRKSLLSLEIVEQSHEMDEHFDGIENEIKILTEKALAIKISNRKENLFELGAESLSVAQLLFHLSQNYNVNISVSHFYFDPSLDNLFKIINNENSIEHKQIVEHISKSLKMFDSLEIAALNEFKNPLSIIKLKDGTGIPLFIAPGMLGNAFFFISFAKTLNSDSPVYVLEYPARTDGSLVANSMEELATYFITNIKEIQPHGAYQFIGYSFGGRLVFEITKQLELAGEKVKLLTIIDSEGFYKKNSYNYSKIGFEFYVFTKLALKYIPNYISKRIIGKFIQRLKTNFTNKKEFGNNNYAVRYAMERDYLKLWHNHYTEYKISTDLVLIIGTKEEWDSLLYYVKRVSEDMFFRSCVRGKLDIYHLTCDHSGFFKHPYILQQTSIIEQKLLSQQSNTFKPDEI